MLRLMADGAGNRAIGDTFGLSEHRVKQQISTIFDKWVRTIVRTSLLSRSGKVLM